MSVNFRACAGLGFETKLFDKDLSAPEHGELLNALVSLMPQSTLDYFNSVEALVEDLEHELVDEALASTYPHVKMVWYGNPYISDVVPARHFVMVKSTLVKTGDLVDMSEKKVTAEELEELDRVRCLFGDQAAKVSWRCWLEIS